MDSSRIGGCPLSVPAAPPGTPTGKHGPQEQGTDAEGQAEERVVAPGEQFPGADQGGGLADHFHRHRGRRRAAGGRALISGGSEKREHQRGQAPAPRRSEQALARTGAETA